MDDTDGDLAEAPRFAGHEIKTDRDMVIIRLRAPHHR
jgi:hypothetical protein